jgi:hypothetical protein
MKARSPNKRTEAARGSARTQKLSKGGRVSIQIYMTTELFDAVRTYAIEDGRTIAGQFRHMAEFYLKAEEAGTVGAGQEPAIEGRYFGEVPL